MLEQNIRALQKKQGIATYRMVFSRGTEAAEDAFSLASHLIIVIWPVFFDMPPNC